MDDANVQLQSNEVPFQEEVMNKKHEEVTVGAININDLLAQVARAQEQVLKANEQAAAARADAEKYKAQAAQTARPFTIKVSDKGGVSVYGLGRFPVTLYSSQWDTLIQNIDAVKQFLNDNRSKLTIKPPSPGRKPSDQTNTGRG